MCGIVGGFTSDIERGVNALIHRGRDAQATLRVGKVTLGHTRLAIIDLDPRSNQPFTYGNVVIAYNGELWNYVELRNELIAMGYEFNTTGDTEVVACALSVWGVDALDRMNGMFAVAWTIDGDTLYLARDRFGEIPLHVARQRPFLFASELKALLALGAHPKSLDDIPAGYYAVVTEGAMRLVRYYDIPIIKRNVDRYQASQNIYNYLRDGTIERTISDVPVCTLLSGGIDSAAVAYFLTQHFNSVTAYTAVYDKQSRDLKSARLVADYLGIQLIDVPVSIPSADDLAHIIQIIEMPYKAQIEIGWACFALAARMQSDGFKVCYSGEGSDELWGSYGFAYHALKTQDYHSYRKDLFMSQQRKNFIRCNKIFMAHTIECRLPFLNRNLVEYAISLTQDTIQDTRSKPKAVLQEAFYDKLPSQITRRAKVAFQDGMGLKDAISRSVINPVRYYNAEYKRQYTS